MPLSTQMSEWGSMLKFIGCFNRLQRRTTQFIHCSPRAFPATKKAGNLVCLEMQDWKKLHFSQFVHSTCFFCINTILWPVNVHHNLTMMETVKTLFLLNQAIVCSKLYNVQKQIWGKSAHFHWFIRWEDKYLSSVCHLPLNINLKPTSSASRPDTVTCILWLQQVCAEIALNLFWYHFLFFFLFHTLVFYISLH